MNASEVLRLINLERQSRGLTALSSDNSLRSAAETKAEDMSGNGYFSHKSPSGVTFLQLIQKEGYAYKLAAENIAFNSDPQAIVAAWMRSPGHRANILNPAFDSTGLALSQGIYQGRQVTFAVQLFAKSQNQKVAAVPATIPVPTPAQVQVPLPAVIVAPTKVAAAASPARATSPAPSRLASKPVIQQIPKKTKNIAPISTSRASDSLSASSSTATSSIPQNMNASEVSDIVTSSISSATTAVATIVSEPPAAPIVQADHSSGLFVAPALLAAAAIASLRTKPPKNK